MSWPPIETAPRDGTEVLIYDGTDKIVVYYSEMYSCFMDRHGDRHEPTIWHPLPPAPVVKDSLTPALPMDDDLDEPLGQACSRENPECEACQ